MTLKGPIKIKIEDPEKVNMVWVKRQRRLELLGFEYARDNIAQMVKEAQCPNQGLRSQVIRAIGGRTKLGTRYECLTTIGHCFSRLVKALRDDCRSLYNVDRPLLDSIIKIHALQMRKLIDAAYDKARAHQAAGEL